MLIQIQNSINILDALFAQPIFTASNFVKLSQIPKSSVIRFLKILKDEGVLVVLDVGKGRKGEVLMFKKLIDIVK